MSRLAWCPAIALLLGACGHKEYMHAQSVQGASVSVMPTQIWVGGGKLWVRTTVLNNGRDSVTVIRDAVTARLPNGTTMGRASGKTTLHQPYVLPPGGAHAVYVEFEGD